MKKTGRRLKRSGKMKLRISNFKGHRNITDIQSNRAVRVDFELSQRAMLSELTKDELRQLRNQCEEILCNPQRENIIYLSNIITIEEVSNE